MKVRMGLGAEGYGIFFMLIERLREEEDYKSTVDYTTLAFDLRVDPKKVKQVVENYDLFKITEDGKYFYSDSFNERMEMMDAKRKKRAEAGKKGAEKRWENRQNDSNANGKAIAMPKQNDSNAIAIPKQSQCDTNGEPMAFDGNKIKLNKMKLNKTKINKTKPEESKPDKELVTGGGSTDNDVQELIEMYQENFGVCNPLVINDIQNSLTMFDKDVVIESFRLSIGKDNPYLYMKGIWKKWKDEGVITLEQVQASNARHEKNKPTNYKKGGYVEIVPDWAN
jgi:dnaD and phage-associated domain protein